jgi:glutamate synthase (NADPH/NADH) large chain
VDLEPLHDADDLSFVLGLIERHLRYTGSTLAARLIADWTSTAKRFVRVMPRDYRRVLEAAKPRGPVEALAATPLLRVANG